MTRKSVSSSNIASIGHDPQTNTLEVAFLNGSVYQYSNVPTNVYAGLMNASSHGTYLNANIKGTYSYRQIS